MKFGTKLRVPHTRSVSSWSRNTAKVQGRHRKRDLLKAAKASKIRIRIWGTSNLLPEPQHFFKLLKARVRAPDILITVKFH